MIHDEVRQALKVAACMLSMRETTQMLFEWGQCQGVIKTDWEFHRVQALSGYLFKSEVALPNVPDYQVNFLLSETDLQTGVKILEKGGVPGFGQPVVERPDQHVRLPVEDFYHFEDLRAASRYYN